MARLKSHGNTASVPLRQLPATRRLDVRLEGTEVSGDSYEVLFFLNLPPAEAERAGPDHPRFAGSVTMFGSGAGYGAEEEGAEVGPVDLHTRLLLPAEGGTPGENELTVVLQRPDGTVVDPAVLHFESMRIEPAP